MDTQPLINFSTLQPDFSKLIEYGFNLSEGHYHFETVLNSCGFHLRIDILPTGGVNTVLIDPNSEEEYTLHLNPKSTGEFVGRVRQEYNEIYFEIIRKCFNKNIFKTELAKKIIEYVRREYSIEFEYLWNKFPNNAVVRRKDNQKWFAAILTTECCKIGVQGDGIIEVINFKMMPEDKEKLIDNYKYLPGYHMNKNHWFTICLDGRVSFDEIIEKLNTSYYLVKPN